MVSRSAFTSFATCGERKMLDARRIFYMSEVRRYLVGANPLVGVANGIET